MIKKSLQEAVKLNLSGEKRKVRLAILGYIVERHTID